MLDGLQYRILKWLYPHGPDFGGDSRSAESKLKVTLGEKFLGEVKGKVVLDFGCGMGEEAVAVANFGAEKVIGLDCREEVLREARGAAAKARVDGVCDFVTRTQEQADYIMSIDAFEHFEHPDQVLAAMSGLLKDGGEVVASFGPTWYHPLGGHSFSRFPWMHLLFSERALIRWRRDFRDDGATRFADIGGGLNRMTIRRFLKLVAASPFQLRSFETQPIRKLKKFHFPWTREFTTAVVRCRLEKKELLGFEAAVPSRGATVRLEEAEIGFYHAKSAIGGANALHGQPGA